VRKDDILTIDDVALEIRVGVVMMRRRKAREEKVDHAKLINANAKLQQQLHAVAGWPARLALPAPGVM